MLKRILAVAAVALFAATSFSAALDFPKQPLTVVCGWAAGGSSDLTCRMVSKLAKKYFGVNANVVNRPGGNGAVALGEMAARTKADGYTIALFASGGFTTMPFVQETGYTIDDFAFIIGSTSEALAVVVREDSELKNLQDIVGMYKKTGDPVNYGMSGSNGHNHMYTIKMFENMGVKEQIIPYPGASGAITALLGEEVEMIMVHPGQVISNIESGDVRLIAMVYNERLAAFPDCPTVEEQGFGKVHADTYKGFIAPKDTDPEIVKWLNEKMNAMMQDPEYIDFLAKNALEKNPYTKVGQIKEVLEKDVQELWPLMEELKVLKPGAVRPAK